MREIKVELTEQCKRNCYHCSSEAKKDFKNFFVKEKVFNILTEAQELNVESVVFTGGEATLYPDLKEVVTYAKELGFKVKMYTMCDPNEKMLIYLQQLNQLGLDEIIYSTSYSLTNDPLITKETVFEFLKNVTLKTNLKLGIHHVITNKTINDLSEVVAFFNTLDDSKTSYLSLLRYVPHGRGDSKLLPSAWQIEQLKQWLESENNSKIRLGSPWNILGLTYTPCTAGSETMIIGFDGRVYPCDAMKYFDYMGNGGNCYDKTLKEIYNSPYFVAVREESQMISDTCQKCGQFLNCHGGCLGQKMVASMEDTLTFEDYEKQALRTIAPFGDNKTLKMNGEMGLIGEIGELVDTIKKYKTHLLDDKKKEQCRLNFLYELGDITWYLAVSLAKYYGYSFSDLGKYSSKQNVLNQQKLNINNLKVTTASALQMCAQAKDPLCPFKSPELPIKVLDYQNPGYCLDTDWKKLPIMACLLIQQENVEEVIKQASFILNQLVAIANYELGVSFEYVLKMNVEKLKQRYNTGFDTNIANERVTELTTYKQKVIKREV